MMNQRNRHRDPYPDIKPIVSLSGTRQRATSDKRNLSVVFGAEPLHLRLRATSLLYPLPEKEAIDVITSLCQKRNTPRLSPQPLPNL